nr:hypothetical protein Itr_chr05CG14790 [Ipomoea trifida]
MATHTHRRKGRFEGLPPRLPPATTTPRLPRHLRRELLPSPEKELQACRRIEKGKEAASIACRSFISLSMSMPSLREEFAGKQRRPEERLPTIIPMSR